MLRTFALLLCLLPLATGCDFLFPTVDDEDDGDPGLVGDAAGTVYRLVGGLDSVSVVWTATVATADSVSFASVGDTVVVGAGTQVHGLDAETGDELWVADVIDQVIGMTSGDGRVYAHSFTALTAIDVAEGTIAWTQDFTVEGITGVSFADPVFANGGVVLGGDPVRRFTGANGMISGTYATGDTEMLGLATDGTTLYVGSSNGISALNSGLQESWVVAPGEEVDRIALTTGGVVFSQVGVGVSLVSEDGVEGWDDASGAVYDALVPAEDIAIAARLQGTVHAFNSADGSESWAVTETSGPVRGLGLSGTTVLYAGGAFVQGLDLADGTVLWEWSPAAAPVGLFAL
jgi:outer membrane protein assembly factor BamB